MRQRGRVPEDALDAPLVLVEAVDRRADDVVDLDVEGLADLVLDAAQGLHGTVVGVDDRRTRSRRGRGWPGRRRGWPAGSRASSSARSCSARVRRWFRGRHSSRVLRSFVARPRKLGMDDVGRMAESASLAARLVGTFQAPTAGRHADGPLGVEDQEQADPPACRRRGSAPAPSLRGSRAGRSKAFSGTSRTSPISSTSRLTAPSSVWTTTFTGSSSARPVLQLEPAAKVDGGHDLAAEVDQPAHHRRRERDAASSPGSG